MTTSLKDSQSHQLGYSDAVRYGLRRALRDYPDGTMQQEYNAGYAAGERKCRKAPAAKVTPAGYSTAICRVDAPGAKWFGKFVIRGSIPATCYDNGRPGSLCFDSEADAIAAILADPWIQATPQQVIQRNDCSHVIR